MFKTINLKTKLPLLGFVLAVCTIVMLQGFDLQNPQGAKYIKVQLIGIDNSACLLSVTNVENPRDNFLMRRSGSLGGGNSYYIVKGVTGNKYDVGVCFQNDGGNIQVIVKDGEPNDDPGAILDPSPGACN